jgi:hypothetical protein
VKLDDFRIILVDSEYTPRRGELPDVICGVAKDVRSGETWRVWRDECRARRIAPYPHDRDTIVVGFNVMSELITHLALGWPLPARAICLMGEFRVISNRDFGKHAKVPAFGLVDALHHFGLTRLIPVDKAGWQDRCIRGDSFDSADDREGLLAYCEQDVIATEGLWRILRSRLELGKALWRGAWAACNARMYAAGIPMDVPVYEQLVEQLPAIKSRMKDSIADYGVFTKRGNFSHALFGDWLTVRHRTWPTTTKAGLWDTTEATWKAMSVVIPEVKRLAEVMLTHQKLKTALNFNVGSDGRSRPRIIPWAAKSGRSAWGNCIFGAPVWLRGLIRPAPGVGLAYLDYSAQEFLISGVLARDPQILEDYCTGDPYLTRAKLAGFAPGHATKHTHRMIRELFKTASLASAYGQTAAGLATKLQVSEAHATRVLDQIKQAYGVRERYFEAQIAAARLSGWIRTPASHFRMRLFPRTSENLLRNWPVQSVATDILMAAGPLIQSRGVKLLMTVHDACVIEAPIEDLDDAIETARQAMIDASIRVLGVPLRVGVSKTIFPDRYLDERELEARQQGTDMWTRVMKWLAETSVSTTLVESKA